jgi:hypothetical protein
MCEIGGLNSFMKVENSWVNIMDPQSSQKFEELKKNN